MYTHIYTYIYASLRKYKEFEYYAYFNRIKNFVHHILHVAAVLSRPANFPVKTKQSMVMNICYFGSRKCYCFTFGQCCSKMPGYKL